VNPTLLQLQHQNARVHLLVNNMLEFWLVHIDEFDEKGMDFDADINPLRHNRKKRQLVLNTSKIP